MKKPGIDSPSGVVDPKAARILRQVKDTLAVITGDVGGEVPLLPSTASLAEVIATVNLIASKINRSG